MRIVLLVTSILALVACGPRVNGAVAKACIDADRRAANAALCNCIGQVASRQLNRSDQNRLISFFGNPELANDIKINDSRAADAFWERYRTFTRAAERSCR